MKKARELLDDEFLVTYADNYVPMDYSSLMQRLKESNALGVMAVLHNRNRWGRSDADVRDGFVVAYSKDSNNELEWINYGVFALRKKALILAQSGYEEEFFGELIKRNELLAFEVSERFYDIGSPTGLEEFRNHFVSLRAET